MDRISTKTRSNRFIKANPQLAKNWDEEYGDRINQLVFIGKNMNEEQIKRQFNDCLA